MPKTLLYFLLIFIFLASCNKMEQETTTRKDLAFTTFEKAKNTDDIQAKLDLLKQATANTISTDTLLPILLDYNIYYNHILKDYDSAMVWADKMMELAKEKEDTALLGKVHYRKGRIFLSQNSRENVLREMYKSYQFYLLSGDSITAGKRLVEVGIAQERLGDLAGSQASAVKALKFLEQSEDSIFRSSLYNSIAITYRRLEDYEEAIKEYKNALRYTTNEIGKIAILNNIALVHSSKKEYSKAFKIWDSLPNNISDSIQWARVQDNKHFYRWKWKGTDVSDTLKLVAKKRENWNDNVGLTASYSHLIAVYTRNDPQVAKQYAYKLLQVASSAKIPNSQLSALKSIIELSNYDTKKYAQQYITISDSLQYAQTQAKNLFAKIRYDEEKKLEEIADLKTITTQQQLEVLRQKSEKTIALLLILLIIAIGIAIYVFMVQRHKREKLDERYDTEQQIAKKIHDELANDIYQIMTQLQQKEDNTTLDQLDDVYQRTRNISRENSAIRTDKNFKEDLKYMISQTGAKKARLITKGFEHVEWNAFNKTSKMVIYRVLQELMVNMEKHSKAKLVILDFKNSVKFLQINYRDNGVGATKTELSKSHGLANTENRIKNIGGTITFESEKGAGFSAVIKIPK